VLSSNRIVDVRSDTVTLPTKEMLMAIQNSPLGDDVYGEDPTVKKLEKMAAEKTGKESALLVTSGTQANLIALMTNCNRGEQVILEEQSHIYWYEVGGISTIAGLFPWPVKTNGSNLNSKQIKTNLRQPNIHYPVPSLICIENTHNRYGGTIVTPRVLEEISDVAKNHSLKVYMDGARIFNASVALNKDVKDFAKHVDNLMFSLSKGLSCPIGSLLVGTHTFIEKARRIRKVLGGGMRQAGIIAAPGIVALETMIDRLAEDHKNAKLLALGLASIECVQIDPEKIETNIVSFDLDEHIDCNVFLSNLRKMGVYALAQDRNRVRMVTHRGVEREDIEYIISATESALNSKDLR
jgi:threonine aldolase